MSEHDTRETIENVALICGLVLLFLVAVALLVGLGFEAFKWLGHTQQ